MFTCSLLRQNTTIYHFNHVSYKQGQELRSQYRAAVTTVSIQPFHHLHLTQWTVSPLLRPPDPNVRAGGEAGATDAGRRTRCGVCDSAHVRLL